MNGVGTRTRAIYDTGVPLALASSAMTVNWSSVKGRASGRYSTRYLIEKAQSEFGELQS